MLLKHTWPKNKHKHKRLVKAAKYERIVEAVVETEEKSVTVKTASTDFQQELSSENAENAENIPECCASSDVPVFK